MRSRTIEANHLAMKKLIGWAGDISLQSINEGLIEDFLKLVRFYLWTGCRRTEATDLIWDDIDWDNRLLYLGQSDSQTKLRRAVPMTDRLLDLLHELEEDRYESDMVFRRFQGWASNISQRSQRIRKRVDELPANLTTHSLRHTFYQY